MSFTNPKRTILAVAMVLLLSANVLAESREVPWSQVAPFVTNRKVRAILKDGTQVEGKVSSVSDQELSIQVRHATGPESVPRQQISSLKVNRSTKRWRVVGTLVGAAAGFPAGVVGAVEKDGLFSKDNGTGTFMLIMGSLTAVGFFIGWAADRRSTTITISPNVQ